MIAAVVQLCFIHSFIYLFIYFSILQSGTASNPGNGTASTSTTPRPDGDPVTAVTVKVEPGTEGNSADVSGTSSANSSTPGPANALTPGSKDIKGNSSSALHWLADLATQKAKDDSKGELEKKICRNVYKDLALFYCVEHFFN